MKKTTPKLYKKFFYIIVKDNYNTNKLDEFTLRKLTWKTYNWLQTAEIEVELKQRTSC